ncbi:uncharacterized protein LOC120914527 [Rana temporaria]|uniref:uncharacterized protein LOC120914527 n=1 Tax=Rana temporaria TaxID=8407 RepID=UPI001AADAF15|nr:uncharacterized protein LOC120914527 [Rana temporaria]
MEEETQAMLREATAAIREQPSEEEGFGALIAAKLKNLERGQRVRCEYLIFKAISMASLGACSGSCHNLGSRNPAPEDSDCRWLKAKTKFKMEANNTNMVIRMLVLMVLIALASGRPHRKLCPVSRYLSDLSSADMTVLKKLQHHHVSMTTIWPSDSLIVTLEQVSLAVDVLSDMSNYAVSDPKTQALMIFLKMKDDLTICRESVEYNEPASSHLKPWLHHLQHFQESASSDCVQDAVMLNLIPLREDVKCWALSQ